MAAPYRIAGEGLFEMAKTWTDSIFEDFSNSLLLNAEALTGNAAKSADRAGKSADHAETVSSNANRLASGAISRVDQTRTQLDAADKDLAELRSRVAWRSVSEGQKKALNDALKGLHGRSVSLSWDGIDPEQNSFAPELGKALKEAGLLVTPEPSAINVLTPDENNATGVLIESRDSAFAFRLANSLVAASLAKNPVAWFPVQPENASARIRVRPKSQ